MSYTAALHQKRNNRSNDSRRAAIKPPSSKRGAAATRRAADAAFSGLQQLEPRQLMAFTAHVDFKPIGAISGDGYYGDTGAAYANRGNTLTYGWNVNTLGQGAERHANSSQKYDTLRVIKSGQSWQIAVPNGTYSVHLVAGDPSFYNSVYRINVEGQLTVNGTPTSSTRFIGGTKTISVTDGKLTVTNASGAVNNKLAFIDITQTSGSTPTPAPTPSTNTAPLAPSNFNASTTGTSWIKLTWTDHSYRETGFRILRSTDGSNYTQIATVGANTTRWYNTGLPSGKTYYYKVYAYNSYGTSGSVYDNARTNTPTTSSGGGSTGGSSGTPTPATPTGLGNKGLVIGGGYDPNRVIPILRDLGAKSVRMWAGVGSWGSRWSTNPVYSRAIQYHNAGFKVVLLTTSTTAPTYQQSKDYFTWASNLPGLRNAVDFWEIQNEPDLSKYYNQNTNLPGYVNNELKGAWDALHPQGEKVIGAAPIYTSSMRTLMNAGYGKYTDYANFHFYGQKPQDLINKIDAVKAITGSKPLVSTEWSFQFLNISDSAWASLISQVESAVNSKLAFSQYFSLFKATSESNGGLLNKDYTRNTPLYNEFKSW